MNPVLIDVWNRLVAQLPVDDFAAGVLQTQRRTKRSVIFRLYDALRCGLALMTSNFSMSAPFVSQFGITIAPVRAASPADDVAISQQALAYGLAPLPLSIWYADAAQARSGLLLGVTNVPDEGVEDCCSRLVQLTEAFL